MKCDVASPHEIRSEYALPAAGTAVVVLFLLLSPALVWSQSAVPDELSVAAQGEPTQQAAATETSASQDADAQPQAAALTPAAAPTPVLAPAAGQKADHSEGTQTKRMFWVVPNFAAVSAYTVLPPLSAREKFA